MGVLGAYLAWTVLFILLGGAALSPLVRGPQRLLRFYFLFGAAFFIYAAGWVGAYFTLRGAAGEWLGALVGSVLMGLVFAAGLGALRSAIILCAVLFVANSAGYFIGSAFYSSLRGKVGMLLWGAVYGLCFGAGLGAALYISQRKNNEVVDEQR
jgi:hypothetical protein